MTVGLGVSCLVNASTGENNKTTKYMEEKGNVCNVHVDMASVVPVQSTLSIAVRCVRLQNIGHDLHLKQDGGNSH